MAVVVKGDRRSDGRRGEGEGEGDGGETKGGKPKKW